MQSNGAARQFWERAIARFTAEMTRPAHVEKNGESWHLFSFESKDIE
jgi:hypothetical protein